MKSSGKAGIHPLINGSLGAVYIYILVLHYYTRVVICFLGVTYRYMYLPLGGRSNRWLTVWPIFIFVAIWHDIELKLLVWGGLNAVFLVIEV